MRRVHCPECGTKTKPGVAACVACGTILPVLDADSTGKPGFNAARTIVGLADPAAPAQRPPPPVADETSHAQAAPVAANNRTKVGLADPAPRPKIPSQVQRTILGGISPAEIDAPKAAAVANVDTTLRSPGKPSAEAARPKPAREMPHELGATIVPEPVRPRKAKGVGGERLELDAHLINRDKLAKRRVVLPPVRPKEDAARANANKRRRLVPIIGAVLVLVVFVVMLVLFVRSSSSLVARVRVTPDGHEAVEITCESCPDGTTVAIGDASAQIRSRVAQIPLVAPLPLGDNRLKVTLDRPGNGRDENVNVTVNVGYRVRPDLSKLTADKPTVHVAIEAAAGTEITIDGRVVKPADGPTAHAVDVTADCSGSSDEPATLSKRIPFAVKFPDGKRDEGVLDVAVAIVPLRIDAPGPRVVTESDTFVLSGHTMKGAEVLAAGRPIQLGADGTFAQRMSVSSIGATNIEVRARIPGMAPRIVPIAVQRVERLEQAAKEFQKEKPVGYTTLSLVNTTDVGRAVIISGKVTDLRTQNHQSIYSLDVPRSEGCSTADEPCRVRLVHGASTSVKVGDQITAYGLIGKPWTDGGASATPQINVAFTLPGASEASP